VNLPANTVLTGSVKCISGSVRLDVVQADGTHASVSCGGSFARASSAAATVESLQHKCLSGKCVGQTSFTMHPVSCPPFSLHPGTKFVPCTVSLPPHATVTLSCTNCLGSTTVSLVFSTTTVHGAACDGQCTYLSYTNPSAKGMLLQVHQSCSPAGESACSGTTLYSLI